MTWQVILGVQLLMIHTSIYGIVKAFPCGEICECTEEQSHGLLSSLVADCSRRNLEHLPDSLPEATYFLNLSGNAITTLKPQQIAGLPSNLLVLDLSGNPLRCEDYTLKTLEDSITLKSSCYTSSFADGHGLQTLHTRGKGILHRARRAPTEKECQKGSPNCVKHICGGREYWLIYATYWGCCKGNIHDLRVTYCSSKLAEQPCDNKFAPQFKCSNGHCVPKPWLCNKKNDCQDGSDEVGCDQCNGTDKFRCWNGRCVPQSVVCDAYNDCGDGSDETFCRTLNGGWCTTHQYRCPTDVCIPIAYVCNGRADCADYSDEIGCNKTCENGWKKYMSSCYKYFNNQRRWTDARSLCQSLSADLVKITSRDVHDFVFGLGMHQPFDIWIGLRQWQGSRDFVWTGGVPAGNFSFWSEGEPSPSQDVCAKMARYDTNGRWTTGKCTTVHSSYVCEKVRSCDSLPSGNDCNGIFEKPKMTSFPSEEIMSASYGSEVDVECKASGFPRPTVMLLINALRAYTVQGSLSFMSPYEANVTFVVKMTSEVECHVSNRLGSSFVRMRINVKDGNSAYLKAVLRLTNVQFTTELNDPLSEEYKTLATWLEKEMMSVYENVADVRDVSVVGFREGSVIADILLHTVKGTSSDIQGILNEAVNNKKVGNAVVESFGEVKACPKEFFNVTWSATFEGDHATQICPRGASGVSKRKCLENGVWGYPDYGQCTTKEFNQLKEKFDDLFNSSRPSKNQVTMIITELSSLTKPKRYDAVMAGNIKISTEILREVVNYNKKFSDSLETESANIEGFLQTVSNLLHMNNLRDFMQLQKTDKTTTDLTKTLEDYGLQAAAGQKKANHVQRVVKDNLAMETTLVSPDAQGPVTFPSYSDGPLSSPIWTNSGKQYITLPKTLFSGNSNTSTNRTTVASFLFRTLTSFLAQESAYEKVGQRFQVESRIISSSVQPPAGKLVDPVVTVFGGVQDADKSVICVYWDYNLNTKGGGWSTDGCWLASRDNGTVKCECNHLTNFAVLMDMSGISSDDTKHSKTLGYITLVGCCFSLLGILITLILHFVLWRILKSPKTVIHVNLCVALLTANILLLIGSASTDYKVLCTFISILLHYFFLSAIFWMLAEGLQIYSAIVKVFGGEGKLKYFYILGWGLPLIIVVPCLGITQTVGYGGEKMCWLSISSGLIWTFIGPVLTVVLINSIIFVLVLRAMMTSHKMMEASDKEKIKLGIKCSVVLLPLLGITWVFGVLAFDQHTVVFLYLFAIFNSLQGFFVFIFHCVFDQQVRAAIVMWRSKRQRTSYASGADTTPKSKRPTSHSLPTERLPTNGVRMTNLSEHNTKSCGNKEASTAWKKNKANRV